MYKYFKFVGGKFFRTINEIDFQVLNNLNQWEDDDMLDMLYYDPAIKYERIIDLKLIEKLSSFQEASEKKI